MMNMKKAMNRILLLFFLCTSVACSERNEGRAALRKMEKIVAKAGKNVDKLSSEEWKALAIEFGEYEKMVKDAIENKKIGETDQTRCIALTSRWTELYEPIMLESLFPDLREPLQNLSEDLKKMAEELKEEAIMKRALELGKDSLRGEID